MKTILILLLLAVNPQSLLERTLDSTRGLDHEICEEVSILWATICDARCSPPALFCPMQGIVAASHDSIAVLSAMRQETRTLSHAMWPTRKNFDLSKTPVLLLRMQCQIQNGQAKERESVSQPVPPQVREIQEAAVRVMREFRTSTRGASSRRRCDEREPGQYRDFVPKVSQQRALADRLGSKETVSPMYRVRPAGTQSRAMLPALRPLVSARPPIAAEEATKGCEGGEVGVDVGFRFFLDAIRQVETGGTANGGRDATGASGELGPYQIRRCYWLDSGMPSAFQQVRNRAYAEQVMLRYWSRYCPGAVRDRDWEALARIHNGGPNGLKKKSTLPYWVKVRKHLKGKQWTPKKNSKR